MLVLQNAGPVGLELAGLTGRFQPVATASAKFDLSVSLGEERGPDGTAGGISGVVEYATDLFDRSTIEQLVARLTRLLEGVVAAPDRPIGEIDILGPEERATILTAWNATAHPLPQTHLPALFAAQAARTPGRERGHLRRRDAELPRSRPSCEPAGAPPARARGRARGRGGSVRRALARDGDRGARDREGGGRVSAARPWRIRRTGCRTCWRMRVRRSC